jgi:hypothetical protein
MTAIEIEFAPTVEATFGLQTRPTGTADRAAAAV